MLRKECGLAYGKSAAAKAARKICRIGSAMRHGSRDSPSARKLRSLPCPFCVAGKERSFRPETKFTRQHGNILRDDGAIGSGPTGKNVEMKGPTPFRIYLSPVVKDGLGLHIHVL